MKKVISAILVLAIVLIFSFTASGLTQKTATEDYKLAETPSSFYDGYGIVWRDEFNDASLNRGNWTFEYGRGDNGWGNNEQEYYTDRAENLSLSDGKLVITARREDYNGAQYTSARIKTQGLQSFKYGIVEARMKLPQGQGMWPAFWMLGTNITEIGWPKCGEIDIMEYTNFDDHIIGTIHWFNNAYTYYGGPSHKIDVTEYHDYSVKWDEQGITWYVDGVQYWQANTTINDTNEFHENFFILLNLAVGGNLPGNVTTDEIFPASMYVDYVRVYQKGAPVEPTNPTNPTEPIDEGSADLIVTDIKTNPSNIEEGDDVTFTATVKNQGNKATDAGKIVGVRFSVDGLNTEPFTWDDTFTSSIGAGESVDITATGGGQGNKWTATKGNHTIFAWVDDQGRIDESNTNNNTYTKQITVAEKSTQPPVDDIGENDVYLSSATPENSTINSDDKVKFAAMLRNIGENKTGDLQVTFYLDNKKLETVDVPSRIEAGKFIVVRTTAEWSAFMGSHTVKAIVSEKNTALDLDNTNNASKSRFNVNDN